MVVSSASSVRPEDSTFIAGEGKTIYHPTTLEGYLGDILITFKFELVNICWDADIAMFNVVAIAI